jgi:LysR family glycine cleavage system transcriptional activator
MRCFEAAARLNGFSATADELSVTPAAVSQQIKALEEWVWAELFERRSQGVQLTPLGAGVAAEFTAAFDALGATLHRLRNDAPQMPINITALPSVAQLWLSPRLPAIHSAFPDQPISIIALETSPNLQHEMFVFSAFIGHPSGQSTECLLGDDLIFPVRATSVAARLRHPGEQAHETMIYDMIWKDDWQHWLERAGHRDVALRDGPDFSLYSITVDEACNGAGLLIEHEALVQRYLATGQLVAPFDVRVSTGKSLILDWVRLGLTSKVVSRVIESLRSGC